MRISDWSSDVCSSDLPSARGDGQPITSMVDVEPGKRIVHMIAGAAEDRYALGTQNGYGFVATLGNLNSRRRAGKQFITIDRKSVVTGTSVSVRLDIGGAGIINKK